MYCGQCGTRLGDVEVSCPVCGRPRRTLTPRAGQAAVETDWTPLIAAGMSLVIPGLGQIFKGRIFSGVVWFCLVPVGYLLLIIPGVILHAICVLSAATAAPRR